MAQSHKWLTRRVKFKGGYLQSGVAARTFYHFLNLALVLARFDHVASCIVNANHGIM